MATPTRRRFTLAGAGGPPLHGQVHTSGGGRPAVLLCPDIPGPDPSRFLEPVAQRLARAGFTAVTLEFPAAVLAAQNLDAVLRALMTGEIGETPPAIGLLGHGVGGALTIMAAAREPALRALVTWAAPQTIPAPSLPTHVTSAAAEIRLPWLIIHGADDDDVPPQSAGVLHAVAVHAKVERLIIPGADHLLGWSADGAGEIGRALDPTVAWFAHHLIP